MIYMFVKKSKFKSYVYQDTAYDYFLSYKRDPESEFAIKLFKALNKEYDTFIDQKSLVTGDLWLEGFKVALLESKVIILLISINSLNLLAALIDESAEKDNVIAEYELAWKCHENGTAIIAPVCIGHNEEVFDCKKHHFSPISKKVGNIINKIFDLQCERVEPDADIKNLCERLRNLLPLN